MITTSRRTLIKGLATFFAAPAIVRASSLMQIKPIEEEWLTTFTGLRYRGYDAFFENSSALVANVRANNAFLQSLIARAKIREIGGVSAFDP